MGQSRLLMIVGGASGVGKSSVLKALSSHSQVNTGDLFKAAMKVEDRDSIKSQSWIDYEDGVTDALIAETVSSAVSNRVTIIDTHFSAKVHNTRYRIGLRRDLIYKLSTSAFRASEQSGYPLNVLVVLIYCDPYALLTRRRLDTSRKRDLYPADCVRALNENTRCSTFYLHEVIRARTNKPHTVQFVRIENSELRTTRKQLRNLPGLKDDQLHMD